MPVTYRVETLGGSVEVELSEHQAYLTGPAVLVAHGDLAMPERTVFKTETPSASDRLATRSCQCLSSTRFRFPGRSPS